MNIDIGVPFEVCGGLFPLKPIPKRHHGRHHKDRSPLQSQIEIGNLVRLSRSQDSQAKQGKQSRSEKIRELDNHGETSIIADEETDGSSCKKRSYSSLLKEIQAIFAGYKVKKETSSLHARQEQREVEGSSNYTGHQKRIQSQQHTVSHHNFKSPTSSDVRSLHDRSPYQGPKSNNNPACKKVIGSLLQGLVSQNRSKPGHQVQAENQSNFKRAHGLFLIDDNSNCDFDPLRLSLSPKTHVQNCFHHLGDHGKEPAGGFTVAESSNPSGGLSTKEIINKTRFEENEWSHNVIDHPSSTTSLVEKGMQHSRLCRVESESCQGIVSLCKECHIHQIDDQLQGDLRTRYPQNPGRSPRKEAGRFRTEFQQVNYCCHQHVTKQTVVHHVQACCSCPVNGHDDLETLSSLRENTKKCANCSCPQLGVTPQVSVDHHRPAKVSAKAICTGRSRSPDRKVFGCVQRSQLAEQEGTNCALFGECRACPFHGADDFEFPKIRSPKAQDSEMCSKFGYSKLEASSWEASHRHQSKDFTKTTDMRKSQSPDSDVITCASKSTSPPCKLHEAWFTRVHGNYCYPKKDHKELERRQFPHNRTRLNCEPLRYESSDLSPSCHEVKKCKDSSNLNTSRVRKAGSTVHWLDKVIASKRIPAPIIEEFLCGRRRWPLIWKKLECLGCKLKSWDKSKCSSDPCNHEFLSSRKLSSETAKPTVERRVQRRGKLSRLAMSRNMIVRPVLKLSTSQTLWDRTVLRECSECRKPLNTRGGHWSYILKEMSAALESKGDCSKKFSCPPEHGFSKPCEPKAENLSYPELFSAIRLRSKALQLNSETFGRQAALQAAKSLGIKLDKVVIDLLPDISKSITGHQLRHRHSCRMKRHESYFGLSKIINPPIPQQQASQSGENRDLGVRVKEENLPQFPDIWNRDDTCSEACDPNPKQGAESRECSDGEDHWARFVEDCERTRRRAELNYGCRNILKNSVESSCSLHKIDSSAS